MFQIFEDDFDFEMEALRKEFLSEGRFPVAVLLEQIISSNKELWKENQELKKDHKTLKTSIIAQNQRTEDLVNEIKLLKKEHLQLILVRRNLTESIMIAKNIASKLKEEIIKIQKNTEIANKELNRLKFFLDDITFKVEEEKELIKQFLEKEKEKIKNQKSKIKNQKSKIKNKIKYKKIKIKLNKNIQELL